MKHALILAHHYPDGSMGGIRMRRVVRRLPLVGYLPTVISLSPTGQPSQTALPTGGSIITAPALDLAHTYARIRGLANRFRVRDPKAPSAPTLNSQPNRITSLLNRWIMFPDKEFPWVRPATRAALTIAQRQPFDIVFASIYPRSNLLAAARTARHLQRPLVGEYRDLWTGTMYRYLDQPTPLHHWAHRRVERSLLRQASRLSSVCQGIGNYLESAFPVETRNKLRLNYNFFDADEYPASRTDAARGVGPFILLHAGNLYLQRSPLCFLEGLRQFLDRRGLTPADFVFRWLGRIIAIPGLLEKLQHLKLQPFIEFLGVLPHEQALQHLLDSHASLLIQAPNDTIHIPGKLFEAMGARRPVLAIARPCEVTTILEQTGAGLHCPDTPEAVAETLERLYRHHQTGQAWPFQEDALRSYSADEAVKRLGALFDECTNP